MPNDSPNGNNTPDLDFKEQFRQFHSRHRDANGRPLKFSAFFNAALEALIDNPQIEDWIRAVIWVVRYSWGNNSDIAIEYVKGPMLHQQDFANRVGIDKRRAVECFAEAIAQGYLTKRGHLLSPIDQPAPDAKSNQNPQKSARGALFCTFDSPFLRWCEEEWKVRAPADFDELESAEAAVRRIKLVRLGLWREAQRARTQNGPIIIDKTNNYINSVSQSVSVSVEIPEPTDRLTDPSPSDAEILEAIPPELCQRLNEVPSPKLLEEIRVKLAGAPPIKLAERIYLRQKAITSLGLIVELAEDVARVQEAYKRAACAEGSVPSVMRQENICPQCKGSGFIGRSWSTLPEARELFRSGVPFCDCEAGTENERELRAEL